MDKKKFFLFVSLVIVAAIVGLLIFLVIPVLARFFKNRRCGVAVVAERIPFSFRLLRRRHFLKTKDDEILLLLLVDLAKRYEGKILSLHAGTPDMEVFILKNEEALAPFYRILPKGERYDS